MFAWINRAYLKDKSCVEILTASVLRPICLFPAVIQYVSL